MDENLCEIIDGKKFRLPPMTLEQNQMKWRIIRGIFNHLEANDCGYIFSNVAVHFDDENIFIPDFVVVLKANEKILDWQGDIHGAPDMVVEILSKSTRRNDLTVKKDAYERNGVREYWIVDPLMKSIDVYLLRDGKYFFDDEYILFDEKADAKELEWLANAGKLDQIKTEVPVSILDGLKIPLNFIFKWGYR